MSKDSEFVKQLKDHFNNDEDAFRNHLIKMHEEYEYKEQLLDKNCDHKMKRDDFFVLWQCTLCNRVMNREELSKAHLKN